MKDFLFNEIQRYRLHTAKCILLIKIGENVALTITTKNSFEKVFCLFCYWLEIKIIK